MKRKKIAVTLVELLVAIVISSIVIGVGASSIITALRLFYTTKNQLDTGSREWLAANASLTENMHRSVIPYVPTEGGRILVLYEYDSGKTPIERWTYESIITGPGAPYLLLTDHSITPHPQQRFQGVAVTFNYNSDIPARALRCGIRADFTRPRQATVRYTSWRVDAGAWSGFFKMSATSGDLWNKFRFNSFCDGGSNYVAAVGSTNDKTDTSVYGRSGFVVLVNKNNPLWEKAFTYNWVRGALGPAYDMDIWYFGPGTLMGTSDDKSYIAGVAYVLDNSDPTSKPFPFVAQVDIDTTEPNPENVGNGNIIHLKPFDYGCSGADGDINPTQPSDTDRSDWSYINSVQENSDGTLECAGQVNLYGGGVYAPRVVTISNVNITNRADPPCTIWGRQGATDDFSAPIFIEKGGYRVLVYKDPSYPRVCVFRVSDGEKLLDYKFTWYGATTMRIRGAVITDDNTVYLSFINDAIGIAGIPEVISFNLPSGDNPTHHTYMINDTAGGASSTYYTAEGLILTGDPDESADIACSDSESGTPYILNAMPVPALSDENYYICQRAIYNSPRSDPAIVNFVHTPAAGRALVRQTDAGATWTDYIIMPNTAPTFITYEGTPNVFYGHGTGNSSGGWPLDLGAGISGADQNDCTGWEGSPNMTVSTDSSSAGDFNAQTEYVWVETGEGHPEIFNSYDT